MDDTLTWDEHVDYISTKISKSIEIIKRVRYPFSAKGNISSKQLCRQTKNLVPHLYLIDKKDLISRIFSAAKLRFMDYANYIDGKLDMDVTYVIE